MQCPTTRPLNKLALWNNGCSSHGVHFFFSQQQKLQANGKVTSSYRLQNSGVERTTVRSLVRTGVYGLKWFDYHARGWHCTYHIVSSIE